jgi:ABC-type transport system involved in cytochrome bd biosynthesis fused ATPase/permease subunit
MAAIAIRNLSKLYPGRFELRTLFRRPAKQQPVQALSDVSFDINEGEIFGLIGPNGAGKTTLIHLLLGFIEQESGDIYFNEHKASQPERRSSWPRISYTRQQSFLIHDSIQNNITLSEEPDMQRLWLALNETGLANFITESEKGLDTVITENGRNISGGQRQRVMMARALYRDADLYIFDEPFSELDKETLGELLLDLRSLAEKGKMVVLITHDPEALQNCSKIIRLHEN